MEFNINDEFSIGSISFKKTTSGTQKTPEYEVFYTSGLDIGWLVYSPKNVCYCFYFDEQSTSMLSSKTLRAIAIGLDNLNNEFASEDIAI